MTIDTLNAKQTRFNHVLAFEVSKAELLVHELPGDRGETIVNNARDIRRVIKRALKRNADLGCGPLLVICEATGGYEGDIIGIAFALGVACHRAHGSRIRAYAQYRGSHAKSDPIDVRLIANFGRDTPGLVLHEPPRQAQSKLRHLVDRRKELMELAQAETNRLEQQKCAEVTDSIRAVIRILNKSLERIEALIEELIAGDAVFKKRSELMRSLKGVGPVTVATVLAYLPEIGSVGRGTIAALAGLAPYDDDSGKKRGRRHILAGRSDVRPCLYMAATSAIRSNPQMQAYADRIMKRGKCYHLAATAVMRKLLVTLNAIVRDGTRWSLEAAAR